MMRLRFEHSAKKIILLISKISLIFLLLLTIFAVKTKIWLPGTIETVEDPVIEHLANDGLLITELVQRNDRTWKEVYYYNRIYYQPSDKVEKEFIRQVIITGPKNINSEIKIFYYDSCIALIFKNLISIRIGENNWKTIYFDQRHLSRISGMEKLVARFENCYYEKHLIEFNESQQFATYEFKKISEPQENVKFSLQFDCDGEIKLVDHSITCL